MKKELNITELRKLLTGESIEESLKILVSLFPDKVLFTTSLGIEDQVITHIIFRNDLPIETVTLDTGRLFPETFRVLNETLKKYQKHIKVYFPDHELVESLVTKKGPFSFYYSQENRLECCSIRKVEPLKRALEDKKVWISGIRSDQSDNRSKMDWLEYDENKKLYKYYPLFSWTFEDAKNFIRLNNIPYNTLHDRNYVSIGCEPCTRAVKHGDDFRSGRWWWETNSSKECGVHIK